MNHSCFVEATASTDTGEEFPENAHILVLTGQSAILPHAQTLQEFAGRTGQPTAMHGLSYLLQHAYAATKVPHLVCFLSHPHNADTLAPGNLLGCVLFFEYRVRSFRTGMLTTGDSTGIRTVIGAHPHRLRIASLAAAEMLRRGAHIVLVTFKQLEDSFSTPTLPAADDILWTAQTREIRDHLPLHSSFDETLAHMGKRTRTHLRYYRKRLHESIPCDFIPDVRSSIDPKDLAGLNATSLDPIAPDIFEMQYRAAADLPGGFVCGLRAHDGRWLSLTGGWRQHTTTLVQWQMNATGYEKLSLGTAFRTILIEHEIARGATRLCFHGGTSHSMHHAFPAEQVIDLVLRRRSAPASLLLGLTPLAAEKTNLLTDRGNFLADVLCKRDLTWRKPAASGKMQP